MAEQGLSQPGPQRAVRGLDNRTVGQICAGPPWWEGDVPRPCCKPAQSFMMLQVQTRKIQAGLSALPRAAVPTRAHLYLPLHGDTEKHDEVHHQDGPEHWDIESLKEGAGHGHEDALGRRVP